MIKENKKQIEINYIHKKRLIVWLLLLEFVLMSFEFSTKKCMSTQILQIRK